MLYVLIDGRTSLGEFCRLVEQLVQGGADLVELLVAPAAVVVEQQRIDVLAVLGIKAAPSRLEAEAVVVTARRPRPLPDLPDRMRQNLKISLVIPCYNEESVLAALFERNTTGKGRRLQVAMQDAMLHYMRINFATQGLTGKPAQRGGDFRPHSLCWNHSL